MAFAAGDVNRALQSGGPPATHKIPFACSELARCAHADPGAAEDAGQDEDCGQPHSADGRAPSASCHRAPRVGACGASWG